MERWQQRSLVEPVLADHAPYHVQADLRWIDHTAARLDLLARRAGERALEELVAGHEVLFAEETAGGVRGVAGVETCGGAG